MHPLTTIHKLNREAAEAAYIVSKYQYLETLTADQKFGFSQLAPDMQRLIVNQYTTNRKEQDLQTR